MSDSDPSASVARLKAGSRSEFRRIFDEFFGLLIFVAKKYGLADPQCDEVVQDVYLKLWQKREGFKDETNIKGWLIIATKNAVVDRLRRQRLTSHEGVEELPDESQVEDKIQREVEISLVRDFIVEVEAELEDDTLSQFYLENKTAKQIAKERGEAVSTITTKLTRLRRKLKERLKERVVAVRS